MGRLNTVTIHYSRSHRFGPVTLPWASRDALLAEINDYADAAPIVAKFKDVGASTPVELSRDDVGVLLAYLDLWWEREKTVDALPPGIYELRNALRDEWDDTPDDTDA